MPSTPTPKLRLEKIPTGEQINTWGERISNLFTVLETAVAGVGSITVDASGYVMTPQNYEDDDARDAVLRLTGDGGGVVTVPTSDKLYLVENACAADVAFSAGNAQAVVPAGEIQVVFCDGTDCIASKWLTKAGGAITGPVTIADRITQAQAPIDGPHLANKTYVDSQITQTALTGTLPGLAGNAKKLFFVNAMADGVEWRFWFEGQTAADAGKAIISTGVSGAEELGYPKRSPWAEHTAATVIEDNTRHSFDTSAGAILQDLPATPADGFEFAVRDRTGAFAVFPLVLRYVGENVLGAAEDLICDVPYANFRLSFATAHGWTLS